VPRRRGTGRGTRWQRGSISGTTITVPAGGVTLARSGIGYSSGSYVTLTEFGKLDGVVGYAMGHKASAGMWIKGGVSSCADIYRSASQTLFLIHGFTTLYGLTFNLNHAGGGVSTAYISAYDATNKGVTITCTRSSTSPTAFGLSATTKQVHSTTVQWVAFGI